MELPVLSTVTFLPAGGALLIALMRRREETAIKCASLFVSLLTLAVSTLLVFSFDPVSGNYQMVESLPWVPTIGITYSLGIDGLALPLVMLTTLTIPIALLSSWNGISDRVKEFQICMLLLETGVIGVFLATDLLLFYIFWEVMLIPMFLLIGVWGGQRRIYAALKFFIYTMAGSVLMLAAILYLYFRLGADTFELASLLERRDLLSPNEQVWLFAAFSLAFAIKVPIWPLHTWLPDAHVEAPTAGSVVLAAVLLKMGIYGFLRYAIPLFPAAAVSAAPLMALLGVIGIVYGALMALAQDDIKKLVAYSSVSHLGFVVIGTFTFTQAGVQGAIYQMVSHGISTGALFLLVGALYERRHTRDINHYGGIARPTPALASVFLVVTLSSIALPGTNGFVGEFLILLGTFQRAPALAAVSTLGIILGAAYMLWMYQRVMLGPIDDEANRRLPDLTVREWTCFSAPLFFIFVMGIFPKPFLSVMEATVKKICSDPALIGAWTSGAPL